MKFILENQYIPKELESYIKEDKKLYDVFSLDFNGIKPKNTCGFLKINNQEWGYFPTTKYKIQFPKNIYKVFFWHFIWRVKKGC